MTMDSRRTFEAASAGRELAVGSSLPSDALFKGGVRFFDAEAGTFVLDRAEAAEARAETAEARAASAESRFEASAARVAELERLLARRDD